MLLAGAVSAVRRARAVRLSRRQRLLLSAGQISGGDADARQLVERVQTSRGPRPDVHVPRRPVRLPAKRDRRRQRDRSVRRFQLHFVFADRRRRTAVLRDRSRRLRAGRGKTIRRFRHAVLGHGVQEEDLRRSDDRDFPFRRRVRNARRHQHQTITGPADVQNGHTLRGRHRKRVGGGPRCAT